MAVDTLRQKRPKILLLNISHEDHQLLLEKGYNVERGFTETQVYGPPGTPLVNHYYPSPPYEYDLVIFNCDQKLIKLLKSLFQGKTQSNYEDMRLLCHTMTDHGFVLAFVAHDHTPKDALRYAGLENVRLVGVDPRDTTYDFNENAQDKSLLAILKKHSSTIERPVKLGIDIHREGERESSLLKNKKGQTVAACFFAMVVEQLPLSGVDVQRGPLKAVVLPTFKSNIRVAVEILKYLEVARPDLFPEDEAYKWLLRDEYKFDEIKEIENEMRERQESFEQEMEGLEDEKRQTYQSLKHLHQVLVADDSDEFEGEEQLSPSIKKTLEEIGFQVELVDEQLKKVGRRKKREDLLVRDGDFVARAECKGTQNQNASETYFGQIERHLRLGPSEVDGKMVSGLLIVNHDRKRDAFRRDPPYCNEDGERLIATHDDIGVLWTVELYKIALAVRRGELTPDEAKRLIKQLGRITYSP